MESQSSSKAISFGLNSATFFTLFRLIFSPLVLPFLLVYLLPLNTWWINLSLAGLFVLISLTDFLDGFLARSYNQVSWFGKILDPIADKALFYSVLVSLVAAQKLYFYWAVILIGREFFVLTLRHLACQRGHDLEVSFLAKIKTALMMTTLTFIILTPYQIFPFSQAVAWHLAEWALLASSIILSLYTAYQYQKAFVYQVFSGYAKT